MAKAKYTKGADGYFTTKTWDGSYNQDGTKHRVTLRSKKSSADLEKQVIELEGEDPERRCRARIRYTVLRVCCGMAGNL